MFLNEIEETIVATQHFYEKMQYREVMKTAYYEFTNARDAYVVATSDHVHVDVIKRYMEVQCLLLSPIAPHMCEEMWVAGQFGKGGLLVNTGRWPAVTAAKVRFLLLTFFFFFLENLYI